MKIKDKEKIMLLDVREEAERHIAKLDGGLWIPLMELPKRLKELDKKKEIICYCRTGGRSRLSNFLLWQTAYSEVYFTRTLWPAFGGNELKKAILWYQSQKRNFGK